MDNVANSRPDGKVVNKQNVEVDVQEEETAAAVYGPIPGKSCKSWGLDGRHGGLREAISTAKAWRLRALA